MHGYTLFGLLNLNHKAKEVLPGKLPLRLKKKLIQGNEPILKVLLSMSEQFAYGRMACV